MKRKLLMFGLAMLFVGPFLGCTAALIGGVAGYEVNRDRSVRADVDVSYDRAYDAGLQTVRAMYGSSTDKKEEGWILSETDHYKVSVHMEKLSDKRTRMTVSARKYGLPNAEYARVVLVGILKRIKQQPFWMR